MKKIFPLLILLAVFAAPCFSQNMFLLGGQYNLTKPQFWGAGLGFNLKLFKEYLQNDLTANVGGIWAKEAAIKEPETDETEIDEPETNGMEIDGTETAAKMKFLFYVKDNFYFSLDWKWVGLRAGVFASFGVYGIPDFPKVWDLFFNAGGFVGICILPQSLISITVDVCPGYAMAFRFDKGMATNEDGFSLPLSVGIRFNLDKW